MSDPSISKDILNSGHRNKKNGLTNGSTTTKSTSFPGAISHSRSRSEPAIHADLEVATTGIFTINLIFDANSSGK